MQKIISHIKKNIKLINNESIRLFHGRGRAIEGVAHVNIDYFIPVVVIYLYQETSDEWLEKLCLKLKEIPMIAEKLESIIVQKRYLKKCTWSVVIGSLPKQVFAKENELKYLLNLGETQNIGFFPDMKNIRKWLIKNSGKKKILNLFSYTCSLSVAAIKGNADSIINVDMNRNFLSTGKKNHSLNHCNPKKVKYLPHNIFKSWSKIKKLKPYDIILIDPPFFQSGSFSFKKDYQKIIGRLAEFAANNGQVIATLNHPLLKSNILVDMFAKYSPQCQLIKKLETPNEFKEKNPDQGLRVFLFEFNTPDTN